MSTSTATPAPATGLVTTITTDTLKYAPAVLAGVQTAEAAAAQSPTPITGTQKFNAVLQGIQAGSADLSQEPGQVGAIAGLINLFVSIFNSLGIFKHSTVSGSSGVTNG